MTCGPKQKRRGADVHVHCTDQGVRECDLWGCLGPLGPLGMLGTFVTFGDAWDLCDLWGCLGWKAANTTTPLPQAIKQHLLSN